MDLLDLEAHLRENNRQEAPTNEQLEDLDLLETMRKILKIPVEVKKILARRRLMPWFRLPGCTSMPKSICRYSRVCSSYKLDIGSEVFKRAFVTHRNAVTTSVKRTLKTIECDGREREEMKFFATNYMYR